MYIKIHQYENNLVYNILDRIIVYLRKTKDSRDCIKWHLHLRLVTKDTRLASFAHLSNGPWK